MNHFKKLSILFMDAGLSGQGGSFVSLLQLLKLLAPQGHRLHVVLCNDSPYLPAYKALGATVIILNHPFYSRKNRARRFFYNKLMALCLRIYPRIIPCFEWLLQWRCYRQLLHYSKKAQIDIVHTNNQIVRNFLGALLAKKLKCGLVMHLRTLNGYGCTKFHLRMLNKISHCFLAVSNSSAHYWTKIGVPSDEIITLANPYDGELTVEKIVKPLQKNLVYVGRLEKGKGLEYLLNSFAQLLQHDSDFTLSLIGDGALKEKLETQAKRLNIAEKIKFLGYIYDAKKHLSDYDALIFPSAQEGFGRVLLEAMAAQIPVIATSVSGVMDIISDNNNGLLVPYNDCEKLVDTILRLFSDSTLRQQLVKNAYHDILEKYQPELYGHQLEKIYNTLTTKQKKKLCIVISEFNAGGAQRVLANLLLTWQYHYDLSLITAATAEKDFFQLPKTVHRYVMGGVKNAPNGVFGLLANLKRIWLLRRIIKKIKPQIILSFIAPTNILTILATRGLKTHLIISERNDPEKQSFGWIWDRLRKYFYRYADAITANSQGVVQGMENYVPRHKLHWVPNPLNIPSQAVESVVFSKPTILAVGRLHFQKGYDILLQAFAEFKKNFPEWQLVILGEGDLKETLQQLAKELKISQAVIWQGNVPDPFSFYRAANFFVLASRYEGVPNTLLEAMAAKLPVIVTDASPGLLEHVQHAVNGLVVAKENPSALSNAMSTFASNLQQAKKFAITAQKSIDKYSQDKVFAAWDRVLNEKS